VWEDARREFLRKLERDWFKEGNRNREGYRGKLTLSQRKPAAETAGGTRNEKKTSPWNGHRPDNTGAVLHGSESKTWALVALLVASYRIKEDIFMSRELVLNYIKNDTKAKKGSPLGHVAGVTKVGQKKVRPCQGVGQSIPRSKKRRGRDNPREPGKQGPGKKRVSSLGDSNRVMRGGDRKKAVEKGKSCNENRLSKKKKKKKKKKKNQL